MVSQAEQFDVTCADGIMRLLERYGFDTIFSIPGVHTVDFYRTFPERDFRHVTPRHEQGAAFMAYGYAFATGRPACCLLITGPGLLNAGTGIAEAYSDSLPMLVLTASNQRAELGVGRGCLHETKSQYSIEQQIAGFSHLVLDTANVAEVLHRSISLFVTARPRPAIIEIPRDLLAAPTRVTLETASIFHPPAPAPEAAKMAADLVAGATRPIAILGGGCRRGADAVLELVERLGIIVVTTNAGKGVVPEDHPLSLGSSLPFEPVRTLLEEADVVLAIGTELGETDLLYTCKPYRIPGKLIRIDIDPHQLTMNFHPSLAILSDAGLAAKAICKHLSWSVSDADRADRADREKIVRENKAKLAGEWSAEAPKHKAILDVLAASLDRDALICADSTQLAYTGNHYYPSKTAGAWLFPNGYGTLGSAMPAAIGAKIGCPSRQVVAIVGDGSFLYTLEELATAVENRIGIPIVLWNNQSYGEIKDAMKAGGIPTIGVDLYTPDFVAIARGFGCQAILIESLSQFEAELGKALSGDVPTLLQIDADGPSFAELAN